MDDSSRKKITQSLKRVVIKIGSSVISHREPGKSSLVLGLNPERVRHYSRQIKRIVDTGCEVVLVSSGAIMAGRERL